MSRSTPPDDAADRQLRFSSWEYCHAFTLGSHSCAGSDEQRFQELANRYQVCAWFSRWFEATWLDRQFHLTCRQCHRRLSIPDERFEALAEGWLHRDRCFPADAEPSPLVPKPQRYRDLVFLAAEIADHYRTVQRRFNVRPRFGDRRRRLAVYTVECVRCGERLDLTDAPKDDNGETLARHNRFHRTALDRPEPRRRRRA